MNVMAWLESVTDDVAITAVTLAELLAGLRRLPDGKRKTDLTAVRDAAAASPRICVRAAFPCADVASTALRGYTAGVATAATISSSSSGEGS